MSLYIIILHLQLTLSQYDIIIGGYHQSGNHWTLMISSMGLIHYFYAHIILFNSPCVLGSQPCYVLFANGASGVEYFFHCVFQPILATPLLDNKANAFQYIYK